MSKTPIVDAEILKMKAELRNYPEYDRIFEQYQSMRDLARELEEKLAAEQANRTWQPIATAPQGYSNDVLLGSAKDEMWRLLGRRGSRAPARRGEGLPSGVHAASAAGLGGGRRLLWLRGAWMTRKGSICA